MPTDFILPELGENIENGDVLRVLVQAGDTIAIDQPVLELETEKATIEVPSSVAGRVTSVHVQAGDKVSVGQAILTVEGGRREEVGAAPVQQPADRPELSHGASADVSQLGQPPVGGERTPIETTSPTGPVAAAAPSVRRLARELGVEIGEVVGTGGDGRISLEDVKAHARRLVGRVWTGARPAEALPDFSRWGAIERQPMRAVRRKTAERLSAAWTSIPHVTQHDLADISALEALRKQHAPTVAAAGGSLTITVIALKVVAAALKAFPQFNASLDLPAEEIIYKKYVHIGVAVDTDRGLLVPVIRDVDTKNLLQLSVELAQAADRARARKLTAEEMQGGCFTITNLGGIGGTSFSPIVNLPEVAILGISRASIQPVYRDDQLVPRLMLPLSLSYDHRAIDGAEGIRFLRWVAAALEQPFLVTLQG